MGLRNELMNPNDGTLRGILVCQFGSGDWTAKDSNALSCFQSLLNIPSLLILEQL